jgi:low affinity Fe/Cu permease
MKWMDNVTERATRMAGSSWALMGSVLVTLAWFAAGPFYHFSDTWQLYYNTITSIVTFVMVFIIQRDQNKQTLVLQTKLNELLAASQSSNRLIDIERLTEEEVRELQGRYQKIAKSAARSDDPHKRTSIDHVTANEADAEKVPGKPT